MAATSESAKQPPIGETLYTRQIISIFVLRLQASIQNQASKLACNAEMVNMALFGLLNDSCDVKRAKKLLHSGTQRCDYGLRRTDVNEDER